MRRTKIELDRESVLELENIVKRGKRAVREVNRARILLLSNSGKRNDEIAETLCVNRNTVLGVKKRYLRDGMASALHDAERSGQPKKYGDRETAEIIALACSSPPDGRKRWTVRLIAEEMKKKEGFEGINRESVRLIPKKNKTKPWKRRMWCIRTIDEEYRKRMYDIIDLYTKKNRQLHVIAIDEKPKQIVSDKRKPMPMKPGSPERYDYEYVRKGTANIFVAVEFRVGKRITSVTKRRTKKDFAMFVKEVLDRYPRARKLHIVLDNLNTHFAGSFEKTFGEEQAKSILQRIEFHYTPKHASWLNVAEIEINVMDMECTDRRFEDFKSLEHEVSTWTEKRNRDRKKIKWGFDKAKADKKLSKYYV